MKVTIRYQMVIDNYNSNSVVWIAEKVLTHKEIDTSWESLETYITFVISQNPTLEEEPVRLIKPCIFIESDDVSISSMCYNQRVHEAFSRHDLQIPQSMQDQINAESEQELSRSG